MPDTPPMLSPDEVRAQIDAALPEPAQGGYKYALVEKVAKAAEKALDSLLPDQDFPTIACPKDNVQGNKLMGKLPAEVAVPALMAIDLAVSLGGEAGARYSVDPATLADDDGLDMLLAKLNSLADDAKVKKAIEKARAGEMEKGEMADDAPPAPPPPGKAAAYL